MTETGRKARSASNRMLESPVGGHRVGQADTHHNAKASREKYNKAPPQGQRKLPQIPNMDTILVNTSDC